MKKAGIVTITDGSNYGNNLQNYAVIQVLKKLGYDAYTIKTDYEYSFFGQLFRKIKRFINSSNSVGVSSDNALSSPVISNDSNTVQNYSKTSKIKSMLLTNYRAVRFSDFSNKYLCKSHEKCIEASPVINNEYDILVFGSDQIWNFTLNRIKNAPDYYCGNFAPQINKIAYSASVGVDYIPDEFKELFKNSVSKFNAISVREESGQAALSNLNLNSLVTLDPTLMLDCDEWMKIAKKPKYINNKSFILTYFLGDVSSETETFISSISEKYNLDIVNLTMDWVAYSKINNKQHFVTSPSEFVWLVNHCDLVLTDSFHACAFSIIMDKPFRFFQRKQAGLEKMNSRIQTLAGKLCIDEWFVGDTTEPLENVFYKDYTKLKYNLDNEREFSLSYLENALGTE